MSDDSTQSRLEDAFTKETVVVRVLHPDLFGRQRAKQVPVSVAKRSDEFAYSKMSIAEDLLGVPVDETKFPTVAGHPDLYARVDAETALRPPWEPESVWVLTNLCENGQPSPLCVRSALRGAEEKLAARGWRAVAAGEPEFYLYEPDSRAVPYGGRGVSYTMDRITDPRGSASRIHRGAIELGIGVTAMNREFSTGQFEINLDHGPALNSADRVFLLKTAIKELAILEGLRANFMAKPATGEEGSSLHVHLSLWEGESNLFTTDDGQQISAIARQVIAGIQAHAAAISAFAAPTVNSYKRLRGEGLSPRRADWGEDNRYSYLRVPAERGNATRVELRAGDASASSHLLMAAMIYAAIDGIDRGLEPSADGAPLPRSLEEALQALEQDQTFRHGFGDELVPIYVAVKRAEIAAFESTVTDWEWNTYADSV